jgi:hypothetical protein
MLLTRLREKRNLGSCGRKRQMIVSKERLFGMEPEGSLDHGPEPHVINLALGVLDLAT